VKVARARLLVTVTLRSLIPDSSFVMSNAETWPLLFNHFPDDDLPEEMAGVNSWDVMDQFPPDEEGELFFNRLCAEAISAPKDVQLEPSKYVCIIF